MLLLSCLSGFSAEKTDRHIFTYETDRGVDARIYLTHAADGLPDYYYCDLFTPICLEDLCNPIEVRLEWDLLGNFRNYIEVEGKEITKFDHEPFEEADHKQLKAILADKESLLQDYLMEDLVDTTKKVYSAEIDGLTAATSKTFADKLVPGAIYTCYTLWHLINGEIADRIGGHTAELMNGGLKSKMLLSGRTVYQDFILDGIKPDERTQFAPELFELIERDNPFIAIKSIRNLPNHRLVKEPALNLIRRFNAYVLPVRSAVIQYFTNYPCDAEMLWEWVGVLGHVQDIQKVGVYRIFEKNRERFDEKSIDGLRHFLEQKKDKIDGHDRKLMMLFSKN